MSVNLLSKASAYNKLCLALSGSMEAYHCGSDLIGGGFSLNHLGAGEGMLYLGPGIYFTDSKNLALGYAKYVQKAYLYRVNIQTDGLYDPARGLPMNLREKSIQLQDDLRKEFGFATDKHLTSTDSFKHGKEFIGFLVEKLGREGARARLKSVGINGAYENLPGGALDVCVYDLSIITVIEKTEVK